MTSLRQRLQYRRRASVPIEDAAVRSGFRRTLSDPTKRQSSGSRIESWLRKALPSSSSSSTSLQESSGQVEAAVPILPAMRRRKRDFMQDALVRVFAKHRTRKLSAFGDASECSSSTEAKRQQWLAPLVESENPEPDCLSQSSIEGESDYMNRPSSGFPPFLKVETFVQEESDQGSRQSVSEFVIPPVQIPPSYRKQDRAGGTMVAGNVVIFTRMAFKRRLFRQGRRLSPIPEDSRFDALRFATVCNYGAPQQNDAVVVAYVSI